MNGHKLNRNHYYSFVIGLPSGTKSINFRVPKWAVNTLLVSFVLFIISLSTFFFLTTQFGADMAQYKTLKTKVAHQSDDITQFNLQVEDLKYEIQALKEKEQDLKNILNEANPRRVGKKKVTPKAAGKKFITDFENLVFEDGLSSIEINKIKLDYLTDRLKLIKQSISQMSDTLEEYRIKFASTPSIWPVHGRILSKYGWRIHPITKQKRLHNGIDIPSWFGTPVQATADGIVKYSGWSASYGNVIVINHDHGYQTVYAHCAQRLIKTGDHVKKGQVIAQLGKTGLSTGYHIHYEVRRWKKPVRPNEFLDLDMFTAIKNMW